MFTGGEIYCNLGTYKTNRVLESNLCSCILLNSNHNSPDLGAMLLLTAIWLCNLETGIQKLRISQTDYPFPSSNLA